MEENIKNKISYYTKIASFENNVNIYFVKYFVLKILITILLAIIPFFYQMFVDDVLIECKLEVMWNVCVGYCVTYVTISICRLLLVKIQNNCFTNLKYKASKQILRNLIHAESNQIEKIDFMDYKSRYTDDINNLQRFIQEQIYDPICNYILCAFYFILLYRINASFAMLCLLFFPISFLMTQWRSRKFAPLYEEDYHKRTDVERFGFKTFEYWKEIKSLNIEEGQNQVYNKKINDYGIFRIKLNKYNFFNSFIESFQNTVLLNISVYLIGTIFVLNNHITIGSLLVFVQYFGYFYGGIRNLQNSKVEYQKILPGLERVFHLLFYIKWVDRPKLQLDKNNLNISIKDVSFAYTNHNVIKKISLDINQGDKVVIIGESGSGKSTLLKVILNIYTPDDGKVIINDKDICQYNIENYYNIFSSVMQEPIFLNMSIWENFKLMKEQLSIEDVERCCKAVGIYEHIMKLPNQFDTVLGENAEMFSRGQRQRLSIARTLLIDAPVLVLDEITASLDVESEGIILDCIDHLPHSKTVIMVTHNIKLIPKFNKVAFMDNGKIIVYGKHSENMKNSELYKKLFVNEDI